VHIISNNEKRFGKYSVQYSLYLYYVCTVRISSSNDLLEAIMRSLLSAKPSTYALFLHRVGVSLVTKLFSRYRAPHPTSHISPTINMSSPLADFMTRLQQVNSLSTDIALISDNARNANRVIVHTGYHKPARPSRWAAEKKTQISPQAPPRRGSIEWKAEISPKFPSRPISPRAPSRQSSICIKCVAPKLPSRQNSLEWRPALPPAKAA
jgi:hypothetical protein